MNEFIQSWSDGGYAAFTNFGVAVLSLIVAICAWVSSSKANRRLIAIEEGRDRKADKAEAKARIVAGIVNPARHTYHLVIQNDGMGQARDIRITLDGREMLSHPAVPRQELKTSLGPMSSVKYMLSPSLGTPNPSSIRIEWCDDSGDAGLFESHL